VATVEPDLEPAPADRLDIDGGEDKPDMRCRAVDLAARAGAGSGSAGGVAGMEALEDRPAGGSGEDAALGREQLESVIGGGIVAGGNLQPAGRSLVADDDPHRRRRRNPGIDDVAPVGQQSQRDRVGKHPPVRTAVTTEDDRPWRQLIDEGPRVADRHLRRERASDDATQSGNADDEGVGHGNSGMGTRATVTGRRSAGDRG